MLAVLLIEVILRLDVFGNQPDDRQTEHHTYIRRQVRDSFKNRHENDSEQSYDKHSPAGFECFNLIPPLFRCDFAFEFGHPACNQQRDNITDQRRNNQVNDKTHGTNLIANPEHGGRNIPYG